jgi:hypothetical protein
MDPSDILTLFPRKVKNPKSSKPKTKAKGGRLTLYQVKILVAILIVIFGYILVIFVGVTVWEYRKGEFMDY